MMRIAQLLMMVAFVCLSCTGSQKPNVVETESDPWLTEAADILKIPVGDSVVTNKDAEVYDRPNGTPTGEVVAQGTPGVVTRSKDGWAEVDFDGPVDGIVKEEDLDDGGGQPTDPVASFVYTSNELLVNFTDTSTDDGTITTWDWSFGDGELSPAQNPTHVYMADGTYNVELTVTDDDGGQGSFSQAITVATVPPIGEFDNVVIIGCSNTDNWLNHGSGDPDITLNPGGGQSGKTIVSYGEKEANKRIWNKFKDNASAAGQDLDLALYMICQRYGPGLPAARQQDVATSLPAPDSGSDIYSEKELAQNILGEMRQILDDQGLSHVPVGLLAMHFYNAVNGDTNPCSRIGSNGILAQWSYVDEIVNAGAQSSLMSPGTTFTPLPLVENGAPWRMPAVSSSDTISDNCHLGATYVQNTLMPSFKTMLAGL